MGTTAVTSLLGFGFWLIAARVLPAVYVGRAAALVSAMLLVAVITNLGLGQVLISRLGSRADGREWSLTITTSLVATASASLVGGLLAAAIIPALIPDLRGDVGLCAFAVLPLGWRRSPARWCSTSPALPSVTPGRLSCATRWRL